MTTLQVYEFQGYQFDWTTDSDGNPVCQAQQLGIALGFTPSYVPTVVERIYPKFKFQSSMGKPGRPSWYLREPGIYQMIFESKSDLAQKFQLWVFEDVLPKLRASSDRQTSTDAASFIETATTEMSDRLNHLLELERSKVASLQASLSSITALKVGFPHTVEYLHSASGIVDLRYIRRIIKNSFVEGVDYIVDNSDCKVEASKRILPTHITHDTFNILMIVFRSKRGADLDLMDKYITVERDKYFKMIGKKTTNKRIQHPKHNQLVLF